LARRRAPEKLPKKEQKLFESAKGGRVFLIPAALEEHRESAESGQETGCLFFWFFSLEQAKKRTGKGNI